MRRCCPAGFHGTERPSGFWNMLGTTRHQELANHAEQTTECVATNLILGVCLSNGRRFDEGTIDRYIYCSHRMQNCRCRMGTYILSILVDIIATPINCRVASITHLPSSFFFAHKQHINTQEPRRRKTSMNKKKKKNILGALYN